MNPEGGVIFETLDEHDGLRVSRSPWGSSDEIGRLNWMTPESQANVLRRLDGRDTFDLAVDYFLGMPSWVEAGDPRYEIAMTHTPVGTVNDDLTGAGELANRRYSYAGSSITMYTHTGTHVCCLNHIGHGGRFWNGWSAETHLGSRAWTVGGVLPTIIARAVLLDIASDKAVGCLEPSYAIADDIRDSIAKRRVTVERGDIALIRTGQMTRWPDPVAFLINPPGLGMDAARYLCEELEVMCLGVDAGGEALPPVEARILSYRCMRICLRRRAPRSWRISGSRISLPAGATSSGSSPFHSSSVGARAVPCARSR